MHYLLLFTIVLAVGVVPIFGPPSLVFAIYFFHRYHLAFAAVVLITALATTLGRLLLAFITRRAKDRIPVKYVDNLDYSKKILLKKRTATTFSLGLFLLSPVPSAQLFEAAGLLDVRLLPLGVAFFAGRIISLSIYLVLARYTATSLQKLWESGFNSWWAIVFELLAVLLLIAMLHVRQLVQKFGRKR